MTDSHERCVLRGEYIALDQLLKLHGAAGSGGEAHALVDAGEVRVDGAVDTRRRAKIRAGQRVEVSGALTIDVVAGDTQEPQ